MKRLKIRTLKKGWHDKDELLLHAAFQLLADFLEKEQVEQVAWDADERHARAWREIRSLYRWWKEERPARSSPLDDKKLKRPPIKFKKIAGSKNRLMVIADGKKYQAYKKAIKKDIELEQQWLEEDQTNLHRLIEVRPFLWT